MAPDFERIAFSFAKNIESVRTLTDEIARLADEHDVSNAKARLIDLLRIFGVDEERLADLSVHFRSDNDKKWTVNRDTEELLRDILTELFMAFADEKPEQFAELEKLLFSMQRGGTRQGQLLRRGAVTLLVSFFETLISELVQAYSLLFPDALPADTQAISLSELRRLGSLQDAESHIAAREAEKLLREPLEGQLKFFASRFKLDHKQLPCYAMMTEIAQRRNVVVHNDAVVNRIYMQSVDPSLTSTYGLKEGDRLNNSPEYLSEAINSTLLLGYTLLQHCWRKWGKGLADADDFAVHLTYRLLRESAYELVVRLCKVTEELELSSDVKHRTIIVNHAIALRELGCFEEMDKILNSLDWSASSLQFRLTVAGVRSDFDAVKELGPKALAAGEINKHDFARWPAFATVRSQPFYRDLINLSLEKFTP